VNTLHTETDTITSDAQRPIYAAAEAFYGFSQDELRWVKALQPYWKDADANVYILPDKLLAPCFSNCLYELLARWQPDRAHAVLRPKSRGYFEAKIQGSAHARVGSCIWLIEALPEAELDHFIQAFSACRWGVLRTPVFRAWK